jgi:hypothetical protein
MIHVLIVMYNYQVSIGRLILLQALTAPRCVPARVDGLPAQYCKGMRHFDAE